MGAPTVTSGKEIPMITRVVVSNILMSMVLFKFDKISNWKKLGRGMNEI